MILRGILIEESLHDKSVLAGLAVESTEVEPVTAAHQTPWIQQWTMHTVAIPPEQAAEVAEKISHALDKQGNWYADFKDNELHYVIFSDKVFRIERAYPEQYQAATKHGTSLGIPDYQLDFSPDIKEWQR
ncbi:MAG: hypothetical protein GC129_03465 [Proteobacteria bacterium]|nr:hypothetical protein [Pseudomonadota bacterium]